MRSFNKLLLLTTLIPAMIFAKTQEFYGDLRGDANNTIVAKVGGQTASEVAQATKATNSGLIELQGDVIGTTKQTFVELIQGVPAASVAAGAALALGGTPSAVASTLVQRDESGNFAAQKISLLGAVEEPQSAATKEYVDAVATGLEPKTPAQVYSNTNVTLYGVPGTIDGYTIEAGYRILLNGQNDPIENGLWVIDYFDWVRPEDFAAGTTSGSAYVVILEGNTYAGSSWVCDTPNAIIGQDRISFIQFNVPSQTTGNNVGSGSGQIYKNKTGATLNFRTIDGDDYITVATDSNIVSIASNATSSAVASAIVARNAYGDFSANTITANLNGNVLGNLEGNVLGNVLGNVTGDLNGNATAATTATHFSSPLTGDVTGGNGTNNTTVAFVGGKTATNVATATDLALAATNLDTISTIVRRDGFGNFSATNITANLTGSLQLPASSASTPSLNFTGSTTTGLSSPATNSLSISTNGVERMNIDASGNVKIDNFATNGVVHNNSSGVLSSSLIVNNDITNATITGSKIANSTITGTNISPNSTITAAGFNGPLTGNVTGTASGNLPLSGGTLTGDLVLAAGTVNVGALQFTGSSAATGLSAAAQDALIINSNGSLTMGTAGSPSLNINSSGNLTVNNFNTGTAGVVHSSTTGVLSSSLITNTDIETGAITGTNIANEAISTANIASNTITGGNINPTTTITAAGFSGPLTGNVTGHASLDLPLTGGTLSGSLTLPDNIDGSPSLNFVDSQTTGLAYRTDISALSVVTSGVEAMEIFNTDGASTVLINSLAAENPGVVHASTSGILSSYLVTGNDIDPTTTITATDFVGNVTLPDGSINSPSLNFVDGQTTGLAYTADGSVLSLVVNGSEQIGISSNSVAIDSLTSENAGVVHASTTGVLSSSLVTGSDIASNTISGSNIDPTTTITATDFVGNVTLPDGSDDAPALNFTNSPSTGLAYNSGTGVLSLIYNGAEQIKVYPDTFVRSGFRLPPSTDTIEMKGNVIVPTGSITEGALKFAGSDPSTGLSAASADNLIVNSYSSLTLGTAGDPSLLIDSNGNLTVNNFIDNAGVIHANSSGVLSSSLVTNTDIADGTITGTNIASNTITGGNIDTVTTIVAGGFNGPLTGNVTGTASGNLPLTGGTLSGALTLPDNIDGSPSLNFVDSANTGLAYTADGSVLSLVVNGTEQIGISSNSVAIDGLAGENAGVVHASTSGLLSSSLITGNDIDPQTDITAANFIGNLNGTVTGVLPLTGGTLTGALALPAGTVAAPALNYSSDGTTTGTGIYFPATHQISMGTNGTEALNIDNLGNVKIDTLAGTAGVVHNNSSGVLSSSLIVNADISSSAAIADTKLATIATAGKVANSATTATNSGTPGAIVARDGSGNFIANTITANLNGNASTATSTANFSGSLTGDVTGTQGATVVSSVGGQSATNVAGATTAVGNATSANTASTIVARDSSKNFSAGTITASLNGTASGNLPLTGGTLTGPLQLPAGTANDHALKFNGTYCGISGTDSDGMSFYTGLNTLTMKIDAFGVKLIPNGSTGTIFATTTSATVTKPMLMQNITCLQSYQTSPPLSLGGIINVAANTSVLFLDSPTVDPAFCTIKFPNTNENYVVQDGQLFTICSKSNYAINISNIASGVTIQNPIVTLDPRLSLGSTTGGVSVTYIFSLSDLAWYRYARS